jgi:hypothetical protein
VLELDQLNIHSMSQQLNLIYKLESTRPQVLTGYEYMDEYSSSLTGGKITKGHELFETILLLQFGPTGKYIYLGQKGKSQQLMEKLNYLIESGIPLQILESTTPMVERPPLVKFYYDLSPHVLLEYQHEGKTYRLDTLTAEETEVTAEVTDIRATNKESNKMR